MQTKSEKARKAAAIAAGADVKQAKRKARAKRGVKKKRFIWLVVDEHPENDLRVLNAFRREKQARERITRAKNWLPYVAQYYQARKIELQ